MIKTAPPPMDDVTRRVLEDLQNATHNVERAEGKRVSAVIDAAIAGASQRQIAYWAELPMHHIRSILRDAEVVYGSPRAAIRTGRGR